jgi:hypothetical protein
MSRFNEDVSDPQMNISTLNNAFNTNSKVQEMREELNNATEIAEEYVDPDNILYSNIDRANRLLDKIEEEITNGDTAARLFEVSSQLINAITTATTSIVGYARDDADLEYKNRVLELKEKELQLKSIIKGEKQQSIGTVNNNVIVSNREDIMKLISEQKED